MTDKALRQVLDETIYLKNQLGLQVWHIQTFMNKLGSKDNRRAAQVERHYQYKTAKITLDPFEIRSKKEAREFLRHELLHLVMAHMVRIFSVLEPFLDNRQRALIDNVIAEVEHDIIHHFEGILDYTFHMKMKPSSKKKVRKSRKKQRKK